MASSAKKSTKAAKSAYTNDEKHIYFKSNKDNGYQWLSNFWPYVDTPNSTKVKHVLSSAASSVPPTTDERKGSSSSTTSSSGNGVTATATGTKYSFIIDGKSYPSVEHYYHCMKYSSNEKISEDIRKQSSAVAAKKRNTYWKKLQPVNMTKLNQNRDNIMLKALTAKFSDNDILRSALLATGNKQLHEVPGRGRDLYWQCGPKGNDRLGQLLMIVRTSILNNTTTQTTTKAAADNTETTNTASSTTTTTTLAPPAEPSLEGSTSRKRVAHAQTSETVTKKSRPPSKKT